ncbi:MAG: low specificity L-threonine aldolase [Beijerinckiaceae bacterium]|nr:low specificity L-threonine aldolase [Beijerinckiaceae bacterium]
MDFASDNASGASARVMAAIVEANAGFAPAYGADAMTKEAEARVSELFERECAVFLLASGTACNALALASLTPPWGAIFCHQDAHVMDDECGAPEFYTAGAKLVALPGAAGKIDLQSFEAALEAYPRGLVKQVQPAALTISQATESGTLYALDEIAALCACAHEEGVSVHMDGARFANSIAALGCTPAQMTWRAGVDVLSLGASKNGTLACEAVVFFDPARANDFAYRRKRGGHTLSKGRFLAAQMNAWLAEDHWLELARHANACAAKLEDGLRNAGARMVWPRQVNEVFAVLPRAADAALRNAGARYYEWPARALATHEQPHQREVFVRLVCSFATSAADVDRFVSICAAAAKE